MEATKDRYYSILCVVLTVAAVLATLPVLEMGTNDDWAYIAVARDLAATGHFHFNGWIGAMIGVQAAWAALFIRIFGFSFTLVRLSLLPFVAGCAFLLYRLGRSAGLNPSMAVFGTLSLTLSPVFIPLAASFMTDVPAYFFWLASLYCADRALQAPPTRQACTWLAVAALCGVAGGTVRQLVWVTPLTLIPTVGWLRRDDRALVRCAAGLWCLSGAAMAVCLAWFVMQPYSSVPYPHEPETWGQIGQDTLDAIARIATAVLLLILPVLALQLAAGGTRVRKWLRTPLPLIGGLLLSGGMVAVLFWFEDEFLLGNIVTANGLMGEGLELMGHKPEVLRLSVRCILGIAMIAATGFTAAAMMDRTHAWRESPPGLRRFVQLAGPASLFYFALITYRAVTLSVFDRYTIPLLPVLVVPVLWVFQHRIRETPPLWNWAVVALFALFGIATTHDYLAACRARLQAALNLMAAGVPRTHVSAGLEFDGWTQVDRASRLPTPAEQAASPKRAYPLSPPYWFWSWTPVVEPDYIVTYSHISKLADSKFPPVSFENWLPPMRRQVFIQQAPAKTASKAARR